MGTKTLSQTALNVIDRYLHFKIGSAVCSVPYYNNKTRKARAALRTHIGKGTPEDIQDEFEVLTIKDKVDQNTLTNESLKKFLVDNNLGVECSGFVYHILETESQKRGHGTLSKHISFINCHGFLGQVRCSLRPIENCDVETFASDTNSNVVPLADVEPGDIITMIPAPGGDSKERNHILVVHEVTYENGLPTQIAYSHSVAYPEDGVYGTGVRQGVIEIQDVTHPLTDAKWIENGHEGLSNILYIRAKKSKTELRRLRWF